MARRPKKYGKRRYKDNSGWKGYNEELVPGWAFFPDFSFAESWDKESERTNGGKRGGRHLFPDPFTQWSAAWHQLVNYRGLEGISRKLAEFKVILYFEDFSTSGQIP